MRQNMGDPQRLLDHATSVKQYLVKLGETGIRVPSDTLGSMELVLSLAREMIAARDIDQEQQR